MNGALAQLSPQVFGVDQVLSPYIYVFYASFIIAFLFTPVMRLVALRADACTTELDAGKYSDCVTALSLRGADKDYGGRSIHAAHGKRTGRCGG